MALATIQDILTDFPGWATLMLDSGDEVSGKGGGITLVKELRPGLWRLTARSKWLKPSDVRYWSGKLDGLDNGKGKFYGWDFASKYPILYPKGAWPVASPAFGGTTAAVNAVPDGKTLQLKSLPSAYQGKVGDLIQITRATDGVIFLYKVMEGFTASGSGVTGSFEVRPALRVGHAANDAVSVKQPSCIMSLVPGSVQKPEGEAAGIISFQGLQAA